MKKIVWLSDLHLNFLSSDELYEFLKIVIHHEPIVVLITGELSDSTKLIFHLRILEAEIKRPVYFVLGNHDFYHSSIKKVRKEVSSLVLNSKNLSWLTEMGIIELNSTTAIMGHDSWADCKSDIFSERIAFRSYRGYYIFETFDYDGHILGTI